ncbi:MAG: sulfatase-like hydrolase/transferase [Pirellulaceae bacterium]
MSNRFDVVSLVALVGLIVLSTAARAGDPELPNIVFIMADDLGYGDLGCYGQKLVSTPNIDRLWRKACDLHRPMPGALFRWLRAVLMTGLHNGHAPARDNVPHYATYLKDRDLTLAEVLQQAGYRTGGVGKWSLGDAGTEGRRPTKDSTLGWAISIKIMALLLHKLFG